MQHRSEGHRVPTEGINPSAPVGARIALTVALMTAALISSPIAAHAADAEAAARATVVAPFLDAQTVIVGRFDAGGLEDFSRRMERLHYGDDAKFPPGMSPLDPLRNWLAEFRKAGGSELYVVVGLDDLRLEGLWARSYSGGRSGIGPLLIPPMHNPPSLVIPLRAGMDEAALVRLLRPEPLESRPPWMSQHWRYQAVERIGDALFAGTSEALERVKAKKPDPRPELEAAFGSAGDAPVQLIATLSPVHRRVVREMMNGLPAAFGTETGPLLGEGVRSIAFTAAPAEGKWKWTATIQAADETAAARLRTFAQAVLDAARDDAPADAPAEGEAKPETPEARTRAAALDDLARLLETAVRNDRLVLSLDDDGLVITALRDAILTSAKRHARQWTMHNLKQIGIAMHSYHHRHRSFPQAASRDKEGKPLLSWRVLVLPYLDEQKLYDEFKLDEPWDSEHNKKLIPRMPDIYRCPFANLKPGMTGYLVPVGEKTVFSGPEGKKFEDINDGTTNTIMVIEAADEAAVEWTKPEDWPLDPDDPWKNLVGHHGDGFICVAVDGAGHFVRSDLPAEKLRALFTASGDLGNFRFAPD
ncbi:MAG: DUF1559 domain-containing protein [Planctomycetaceae bacterium]